MAESVFRDNLTGTIKAESFRDAFGKTTFISEGINAFTVKVNGFNKCIRRPRGSWKKPVNPVEEVTCKCAQMCYASVSQDYAKRLYHSFHNLSSFEEQTQFLCDSVTICRVSKVRKDDSRRKFTFLYHVTKENGQRVRVCKKVFLQIFGIHTKRLRYLCERLSRTGMDANGIAEANLPFKNNNSNNNIDNDNSCNTNNKSGRIFVPNSIIRQIQEHIRSFPLDSLPKDPNAKENEYLIKLASIRQMYDHYVEQFENDKANPFVKLWVYKKIFKGVYNTFLKKQSINSFTPHRPWESRQFSSHLDTSKNEDDDDDPEEDEVAKELIIPEIILQKDEITPESKLSDYDLSLGEKLKIENVFQIKGSAWSSEELEKACNQENNCQISLHRSYFTNVNGKEHKIVNVNMQNRITAVLTLNDMLHLRQIWLNNFGTDKCEDDNMYICILSEV